MARETGLSHTAIGNKLGGLSGLVEACASEVYEGLDGALKAAARPALLAAQGLSYETLLDVVRRSVTAGLIRRDHPDWVALHAWAAVHAFAGLASSGSPVMNEAMMQTATTGGEDSASAVLVNEVFLGMKP